MVRLAVNETDFHIAIVNTVGINGVPELSDHQESVQYSYPSHLRSAQQIHSVHPAPSDFELKELFVNRDIVHPAPARNSSLIEQRSCLLNLVTAFALPIR